MASAVSTASSALGRIDASWTKRLEAKAWSPVDASSLGAFRFLLGALLFAAVVRHWVKGAIRDAFVVPTHFFAYDGLSFVRPLPGTGMYFVYATIALAAMSLAVGWRSRTSAAVACALFTYTHACDKTNYLNHYYLLSLLLGLAAVLPLGAALSIDSARSGSSRSVSAWMLWLVRFQIGLVYFYGGVGKLETDWLLRAMPLQIWLAANGDFPLLGPILRWPETAYVMSWLGAAFDLSVAFLLAAKRTRLVAYASVVVFHVVTARLFQIGMFPWVMIALTLVFFDPSWPRRILPSSFGRARECENAKAVPRWVLGLAIAWVVIQLLYPLRSRLFAGDVLWTEDGYRFSWRVMLIEKAGFAELAATDPRTGATRVVRTRSFLTPFQEKMMSTQPDMIHAFAVMIADDAERRGEPRPRVTADVVVTLNGRSPARLVDPSVDLAAESWRLGATAWVLPSPRSARGSGGGTT
ncbi:MAG TPA: HTTM domain-containing protein [Labilithrix sp.]|nr:HTTM domain-containing protein [Labilithrix sp.]